MSFKNISCQNRIIELFQNAFANDRLAHAYVFTGQEGVGKSSFSRELAKAIFCRREGIDACVVCHTCQRIASNNFSDIHLVLPEKNSRVIKIEQLKYLQDFLRIKPLESRHKMVIIQSADKMNEEASNCLLKTLEEPPLYAIMILTATSLESVKETIRSRCQIIRFSPLSMDVVKNILINQYQLDNKQAEQVAFIANGSIKRAVWLSQAGAVEKKTWLVEQLLKLECKDNLTFSKELVNTWHIQDTEILEEKRSYVKELLFSFLMYYRDLLVCKTGRQELPIYHDEWKAALTAKSQAVSEDVLFRIIHIIKTTFEYLDQNANIALLLENMITKILHFQFRRNA